LLLLLALQSLQCARLQAEHNRNSHISKQKEGIMERWYMFLTAIGYVGLTTVAVIAVRRSRHETRRE
jgi:hypothetical protein